MTENSASKVPQFNCDQCIFQGASYREVKHHIGMKQKIHQLDGKNDFNVDESQSEKTLSVADDSKSEDVIEKKRNLKCKDCQYTTKEDCQS